MGRGSSNTPFTRTNVPPSDSCSTVCCCRLKLESPATSAISTPILWGIDLQDIKGREELTTNYLRVFASPKFEWNYKRLELTLNLPVNLYSYFFSGGLRNRNEFFFSPSLAARFRLTPRMSLTFRGSARRSPASLHTIHDSSILTDYRSFSSGVDDYYTASGQSVSASYSFRNAQSGIFLMAMGSYGWNRSEYGTVQNVVGDYVFHSYRAQPSDSRNAMAMLNASKTLDFMRGQSASGGISAGPTTVCSPRESLPTTGATPSRCRLS